MVPKRPRPDLGEMSLTVRRPAHSCKMERGVPAPILRDREPVPKGFKHVAK